MTIILFIQPQAWLEDVLASPSQIRFLRLLVQDPDRYWTGREAAEGAGLPQSTASIVVRRLRDLHLLDIRRVGASHLFRLRQDITFTRRLRDVFAIEALTLPEALESLRLAVPSSVSCYLFGSAARGQARHDSDLDILVAAADPDEAMEAADDVREMLRVQIPMPIDVIALGRRELKSRNYAHLVRNVLTEGRHLCGPGLEVLLA